MREIMAMVVLCSAAIAAPAASAQQTTGIITGQLIDAQGSAVPGVTVTGRHAATGFTRVDVSDREGVYRLPALPVGSYDLTAERQGFATARHAAVGLNIGQTLDVTLRMTVAGVAETVTVSGGAPLIETRSSRSSASGRWESACRFSGQRPAAFRRTSGRSEQRIMLFDRERTTGDALH